MQKLSQPTSKVELRISCTKLTNLDTFSKSDPQVYVYYQPKGQKTWEMLDRTEKIQNDLNPIFKKVIVVDYFFEDIQNLKFFVVDVDHDHTIDVKKQDFIGQVDTTLGEIISKPGCTLVKELKSKNNSYAGHIRVVAEEIKVTGLNIKFSLGGKGLDKKDLFGKSDPYFVLGKYSGSGYQTVYTSEVHKNTLDPEFREVFLKLEELCGGDVNRPIQFEFFDWDSVGKHDYIGSFNTTTAELLNGKRTFELINPKKKEKKSGYKNSGVITFHQVQQCRDYTFMDYLLGGCEMNLIVAIDCTGSNGDPQHAGSLHYKHPTEPNEYAKAIVSVGNVLTPYDSDGIIPVYGFGAVLQGVGGGRVNHCFPMSLTDNPNVLGVAGVLDCYYQNITRVDFSGPTYFAPIIDAACSFATTGPTQKYTILLIITDGEICDMENTIQSIVKGSSLPLSIVIVGVGSAPFDNMNVLDGDNGALTAPNGAKSERDIVQFVAFNKYKDGDFTLLANETLKEIPSQLLGYMKRMNIHPNPPRVAQVAPPPPQ